MLINFTVSNFKSIKDEILLNMAPAKRLQSMKDHVVVADTKKKVEAMPVGAIYGANGSGKTNFIEALAFMKERIQSDGVTAAIPFRLADDDQEKLPSTFSVLFSFQKVVYAYGFSVQGKIVTQEWLSAYFSAKETMLFERYLEDGKPQISFGQKLISSTEGGKSFLGFIFQGMQEDLLFLREAVKREVSLLQPVQEWFTEHVFVLGSTSRAIALDFMLQRQPQALQHMNDQLREMGMHLEKLVIKENIFNVEHYVSQLDEREATSFLRILDGMQEGEVLELAKSSGLFPHVIQKRSDALYVITLEVCHIRKDGKQVGFDISTASSGFLRLLELLPALNKAEANDTLIVVDGLEKDLHTLLTQYIVKSFIKKVTKAQNGNQLVFTTHDTNLLYMDLLRTDEIWFMEEYSASERQLCSLAEFKLTTGMNYEKGYLSGRFGGIPCFRG